MTPGRLYLLALLALLLAGLLLFNAPNTILVNTLGGVATLLALVAYLLGLYLTRVGRRGESALEDLRQRIELATEAKILGEHRCYHRSGFDGVGDGELLLFYRVASGWTIVPLLEELTWVEVPAEGVGLVQLEEPGQSGGVFLRAELTSAAGERLDLRLGSTLLDGTQQTRDNVLDLIALKESLRSTETGG